MNKTLLLDSESTENVCKAAQAKTVLHVSPAPVRGLEGVTLSPPQAVENWYAHMRTLEHFGRKRFQRIRHLGSSALHLYLPPRTTTQLWRLRPPANDTVGVRASRINSVSVKIGKFNNNNNNNNNNCTG